MVKKGKAVVALVQHVFLTFQAAVGVACEDVDGIKDWNKAVLYALTLFESGGAIGEDDGAGRKAEGGYSGGTGVAPVAFFLAVASIPGIFFAFSRASGASGFGF